MIFGTTALPLLPGLKPETFCLTFHDVIRTRTSKSLWFDCSVSELTSELDWLRRRGAHFISVRQLYRRLTTGGSLPAHPVCVTFADNYLGFFTYAYPILQRRHIPCAMFVHTGYVGSPIGRPKMNWAQLVELDRHGLVSVESQTVTHPLDLRTMDSNKVQAEMTHSKIDLERHLGHPIQFVAYPNGKFDHRSETAARSAGYLMGFSEVLEPAEASPSIFAVARYVHTKFKRAWADANRIQMRR
jgi:peptidoglycan/xylan/chitin deacetylase (PgdA/CDA1 family)